MNYTMHDLLQAGIHFGHNPKRWDPKMSRYIFGVRNGVHIINLDYTYRLLKEALDVIKGVAAKGGRVLFVATKKQASDVIAQAAEECGQYYVNHRWLGGMLTNWKTVSNSIKRLEQLEARVEKDSSSLTKKELLGLERQITKLNKDLGGIRKMGGLPDVLFVIDTIKETTAIREAKKLGIPIIAVVDSNASPDLVDYIIPGNDDAIRSIEMYSKLVSNATLEGLKERITKTKVDVGASVDLPKQQKPKKAAAPDTKGKASTESANPESTATTDVKENAVKEEVVENKIEEKS